MRSPRRFGFDSTYEGLKRARAREAPVLCDGFDSTYEGLKRRPARAVSARPRVSTVPMRA